MKTSLLKSSKERRQFVARIMRTVMSNTANLARDVGAPAPKWSRSTREFVRRNA